VARNKPRQTSMATRREAEGIVETEIVAQIRVLSNSRAFGPNQSIIPARTTGGTA
jgi:hypothetical protein